MLATLSVSSPKSTSKSATGRPSVSRSWCRAVQDCLLPHDLIGRNHHERVAQQRAGVTLHPERGPQLGPVGRPRVDRLLRLVEREASRGFVEHPAIEVTHEGRGDRVADLPEAPHHRPGAGKHERARQTQQALVVVERAEPGLARGQHDEVGAVEVEADHVERSDDARISAGRRALVDAGQRDPTGDKRMRSDRREPRGTGGCNVGDGVSEVVAVRREMEHLGIVNREHGVARCVATRDRFHLQQRRDIVPLGRRAGKRSERRAATAVVGCRDDDGIARRPVRPVRQSIEVTTGRDERQRAGWSPAARRRRR